MNLSLKRLAGAITTASALGAVALIAAPAVTQADVVSVSACDNSSLTQPFTPWADFNSYKLAPGGDFETGIGGWSLQGGAGLTSGSETYGVAGSVGHFSLGLPSGASATAPQTCVNAAYPSFRFFTRTDTPGATIIVSLVYTSALGTVTIPVGVVTPTSTWEPTAPMLTASAVTGALNGGTANVSLSFVASGGSAQIDDVYVDPWSRCC